MHVDWNLGLRYGQTVMLDSRYVSEHLDEVRGALAKKGFEDVALFERLER